MLANKAQGGIYTPVAAAAFSRRSSRGYVSNRSKRQLDTPVMYTTSENNMYSAGRALANTY